MGEGGDRDGYKLSHNPVRENDRILLSTKKMSLSLRV